MPLLHGLLRKSPLFYIIYFIRNYIKWLLFLFSLIPRLYSEKRLFKYNGFNSKLIMELYKKGRYYFSFHYSISSKTYQLYRLMLLIAHKSINQRNQ